MNVTLSLEPEVESSLRARANERGVSLSDLILELVARESMLQGGEADPARKRFENLSDLLLNSPFAGANLNLERSKDLPREVDLG